MLLATAAADTAQVFGLMVVPGMVLSAARNLPRSRATLRPRELAADEHRSGARA